MENKDILIGVLVFLLCMAIYVIYNFLNYYVYPLDYKAVRYDDLTLRTGDLLFVLQYSSPHNFVSGEQFSHVGIIVVVNNIPHVLELVYPYVSCTEFTRRVMSVAEGQTFYIKSVMADVKMPPRLIEEAKNIKYSDKVISYALGTTLLSKEEINHYITNNKTGICSTFVLWVLDKFKLLDVDIKTPKIITWLANDYNKYHLPTRRIRFFDGTANVGFSDHVNIIMGKNGALSKVNTY